MRKNRSKGLWQNHGDLVRLPLYRSKAVLILMNSGAAYRPPGISRSNTPSRLVLVHTQSRLGRRHSESGLSVHLMAC